MKRVFFRASTFVLLFIYAFSLAFGGAKADFSEIKCYTGVDIGEDVAEALADGVQVSSRIFELFFGGKEDKRESVMLYPGGSVFGLVINDIFTYSPRPGTPAAAMPNRPDGKTAGLRAARLREITAVSKQEFINSQLGTDLQVIFETASNGMLHGWSDNYIAVSVPENSAKKGCITTVKASKNTVCIQEDLLSPA